MSDANDERALVWAPRGRDGALAVTILGGAGIVAERVADLDALCEAIDAGVGCVLLTEETLNDAATERLCEVLSRQPAWSDVPLVVFADREPARRSAAAESPLGNVSFLERPVQIRTLIAAVRAALRGRRRQYAARGEIAKRDEFLAMLGHELRNPLGAIVFATDRLGELTQERPREHHIIARQARHLSRLVDDLLDVSRVTSGKVVLQREPVDLCELVERGIEQLTPLVDGKSQHLVLRRPAAPLRVQGDPVRLEQVINNLVTNAVKYTHAGGNIDVSLAQDDDEVSLRVRDDGIGIDPTLTGAIFDLFTQAPASIDRSQGGLGLGLTLVRSLVDQHGGTVTARSGGLGHGAEFEVRLPLRHVEPDREAVLAPATTAERRGKTVVVVDDNEDLAEMMTVVLEGAGHRVQAAFDGVTGLEHILSMRPDVAIVDIGLPGLDGLSLARKVRGALGEAVRLVAMTGYGQPDDREHSREAGFDVHLVKPASPLDVLAALG